MPPVEGSPLFLGLHHCRSVYHRNFTPAVQAMESGGDREDIVANSRIRAVW